MSTFVTSCDIRSRSNSTVFNLVLQENSEESLVNSRNKVEANSVEEKKLESTNYVRNMFARFLF